MLIFWIIGFTVWVLVLLICFALCSVASRAAEIEYTVGTKMAEESAIEVGERDASVKVA